MSERQACEPEPAPPAEAGATPALRAGDLASMVLALQRSAGNRHVTRLVRAGALGRTRRLQRRPITEADLASVTASKVSKRERTIIGEPRTGVYVVNQHPLLTTQANLVRDVTTFIRALSTAVHSLTNGFKALDANNGIDPFVYGVRARVPADPTATGFASRDHDYMFAVQFSRAYSGYMTEIVIDGGKSGRFTMTLKAVFEAGAPAAPSADSPFAEMDIAALSGVYSSGHDTGAASGRTSAAVSAQSVVTAPTAAGDIDADNLTKAIIEGARFECVSRAFALGGFGHDFVYYTRVDPSQLQGHTVPAAEVGKDLFVGIPLSELWLRWADSFGKRYAIPDADVVAYIVAGIARGAVPPTMASQSNTIKKNWLKGNVPKQRWTEATQKQWLIWLPTGQRPSGYDLDNHAVT